MNCRCGNLCSCGITGPTPATYNNNNDTNDPNSILDAKTVTEAVNIAKSLFWQNKIKNADIKKGDLIRVYWSGFKSDVYFSETRSDRIIYSTKPRGWTYSNNFSVIENIQTNGGWQDI